MVTDPCSTNPICRMWFWMQERPTGCDDWEVECSLVAPGSQRRKRDPKVLETTGDAPSDFHRVRLILTPTRDPEGGSDKSAAGGKTEPRGISGLSEEPCPCFGSSVPPSMGYMSDSSFLPCKWCGLTLKDWERRLANVIKAATLYGSLVASRNDLRHHRCSFKAPSS